MNRFFSIIIEHFLVAVKFTALVLLFLYVGAPYCALFSGIVAFVAFVCGVVSYIKRTHSNNDFEKWLKNNKRR